MSTAPASKAAAADIDPEKLKFLGLVSHELRTPLNAIIGFSNMIEQQMMGPVGADDYVEFAREIQQSGKALLRLVDDLITAARAEAEGLKPAHAHVDLAAAIATAIRDLAPAAKERDQEVDNRVSATAPAIWGDGRAIRQALRAVLDNAAKFAPEGGAIGVMGAYDANGDYRIVVVDSGPGFPEHARQNLAQPFRQGDDKLNRAHEGAGLGLYLARQLMEAHEGRIEVENRAEGGARVALIIPASRLLAAGAEDDLTVMTEDADDHDGAMLELVHDGVRRHLFLGGDSVSIGRQSGAGEGETSDILVEDRRASRAHAQIISVEGRFHLVDESRRGTYVAPAGGPIEHVRLNVSQPLDGSGVIALGDPPDADGVALIEYRITRPTGADAGADDGWGGDAA